MRVRPRPSSVRMSHSTSYNSWQHDCVSMSDKSVRCFGLLDSRYQVSHANVESQARHHRERTLSTKQSMEIALHVARQRASAAEPRQELGAAVHCVARLSNLFCSVVLHIYCREGLAQGCFANLLQEEQFTGLQLIFSCCRWSH